MATTPKITPETRMLVDGKLVEADGGRTFTNVNPATEESIGDVADASVADMHRAIEAARRAFDETEWSTDHAFRQHCLRQLQEGLAAEQDELTEQLIQEAGAPRMLCEGGPQMALPLAHAISWPIGEMDRFEWETRLPDVVDAMSGAGTSRMVRKVPVGVVGAITPWNFPFEVSIVKVAQALATGNTIVLKPAPDTPFHATLIGKVIAERTDIPPGVVNVVTSSDHLVGEELTISPLVDCISFTGSTAVGKRIMEKGAATMKRLFLELGGKSAAIILDDADLPTATMVGFAICAHAGQGCAIPTRMLLPRSRYEEGVELVLQYLANAPYGDPQEPGNLMGPLISATQRERVLGYIQKGVDEGATLALGGGRPDHLPTGFFVEPTVFTDVDNSMTIAREEIFGPVLSIIPFEDDDDAVRIANDSVYGLSGMVTSGSLDRGLAVAKRIRSGTVGVNGGSFYAPDVPFGGFKDSGVGRQNGVAGFEQYLEISSLAWPSA